MKYMIIMILLLGVLSGCDEPTVAVPEVPIEQPVVGQAVEIEEEPEVIEAEAPVDVPIIEDNSCSVNSECAQGEQCINGECGIVAALFDTECESKCQFSEVQVFSSMGDEYTLSRGQGSYTGAGSVEWKLLAGPEYCKSERVIVPIQVIKKNAGKVISKEVLTLSPGDTSSMITHPTITSVRFSLNIKSVYEVCE